MRALIAGVALLLAGAARASEPGAQQILDCMRANVPQTVRVQAIEIITSDRAGNERLLRGRLFGTRDGNRLRLMSRIEFPPDMFGAAYLLRESEPDEEIYVYLPALNRVKRITGAAVGGSLWGTDFSYGDFKQLHGAFAGRTPPTVARASRVGDRATHELVFAPEAGHFDTIRAQVDRQTCVVLVAEFFGGGELRKRLSAAAAKILRAGPRWYPADVLIEDLARGTRTRVHITGVTERDKPSGGHFHPSQFFLAR